MNMDKANYQEYEGTYVAHWEVSHFVVESKKLLGIFPRIEKWWPHFPENFSLPRLESLGREKSKLFKMRVLAKLGPKGNFGHLGICNREIFIKEVIDFEETEKHGKLW